MKEEIECPNCSGVARFRRTVADGEPPMIVAGWVCEDCDYLIMEMCKDSYTAMPIEETLKEKMESIKEWIKTEVLRIYRSRLIALKATGFNAKVDTNIEYIEFPIVILGTLQSIRYNRGTKRFDRINVFVNQQTVTIADVSVHFNISHEDLIQRIELVHIDIDI